MKRRSFLQRSCRAPAAAPFYSAALGSNPKAPGGAEFVPELIHNRSGAGNAVLAVDLNGDGAIDIITSTDRGTFIFWGKPNGRSGGRTGSK